MKETFQKCPDCTTVLGNNIFKACPVCEGENLHPVKFKKERGGIRFSFTVFRCEECEKEYTLDGGLSTCPQCGEEHTEPDPKVEARKEAYGADIKEIEDKLSGQERNKFKARGKRSNQTQYLNNWTQPTIQKTLAWSEKLLECMGSADWDKPEDPKTIQAWDKFSSLMREVISEVENHKKNPPPPILLSYHRRMTGVVIQFGWSALGFMSTLVADDVSDALSLQEKSQRLLDDSGAKAALAGDLSEAIIPWVTGKRISLSDCETSYGPNFRHDALPDLSMLEKALPDIASDLWSIAVAATALHDPERRQRRVSATRSILEDASSHNVRWLAGGDIFNEELRLSWIRLKELYDQLSVTLHEMRINPNSESSARSIMSISTSLTEGPFKRLGAILCVAGKTQANPRTTLTKKEFEGSRNLTLVINYLGTRAPVLTENVDQLMRNASAHEDVQIKDNKIEINHTNPSTGKTQKQRISIDDAVDYCSNILETSTAILIGLVTWISHFETMDYRDKFHQEWNR